MALLSGCQRETEKADEGGDGARKAAKAHSRTTDRLSFRLWMRHATCFYNPHNRYQNYPTEPRTTDERALHITDKGLRNHGKGGFSA